MYTKEYMREYQKDYKQKHSQKLKEQSSRFYHSHKDKYEQNMKNHRDRCPHRVWSIVSRCAHKRAGYIVIISIDELEQLAKKTTHCSYCGCELKWGYGNKRGHKWQDSPSLDRVNNEKELRTDNVEIICRKCNVRKQDSSKQELLNWCKRVLEHQKSEEI